MAGFEASFHVPFPGAGSLPTAFWVAIALAIAIPAIVFTIIIFCTLYYW